MSIHSVRMSGARLIGAIVVLAAFMGTFAVVAYATDEDDPPVSSGIEIDGGATLLTADPGTLGALTSAGFTLAPIEPTKVSQAANGAVTFAFPIEGGRIDPATMAGFVKHSGGLSLNKGETTVRVDRFVIDAAEAVLTARVIRTNERIPLLKLDLTNAQTFALEESAVARGVRVTLTQEAADLTNAALATELFTEGLAVGTVDVFAVLED
jgi:hypothetical protein